MKSRIIKTGKNFTIVNNHILRNPEISWKAKGLCIYLISLPDDWRVNISDLSNRSRDSKDATASGIDELIAAGYCRRRMTRDDKGRLTGYEYEFCDALIDQVDPLPESEIEDYPFPENPSKENPVLLKTIESKDYRENKNFCKNSKSPDLSISLFTVTDDVETEFNRETVTAGNTFFSAEFEAGFDVLYYVQSVEDWANSLPGKDKRKRKTKRGWIATIRNFMRTDEKAGKLKMVSRVTPLNYLKL